MNTIGTLTKSAIKMFVRNRQALFFSLFTPLIIMAIFGLIGFDRVAKINVSVVSNSPNQATRAFIENLKNFPAFNVSNESSDDAQKALADGNRAVAFLIPDNLFPDDPRQFGSPKTIVAVSNAGQQQQAQTAISVLSQTLDRANISLIGAPSLFRIENREVNSRNLKYIDFLLPGIVALAVMQMSVFSVAFVFADYKEKGILKRLLATPVRPYQFITANVITRLLVSLAQALILIAVGVLLFQAKVIGSYFLILLITLIGAVMFLAMGFAISGFASTVESVPAIANLVVFPMLFLGGTFFPIETMPDWLQKVAKVLPLTYFSNALRDVMTKDASFGDIQMNLLWMMGWAAALIVLANLTFKFEGKKV